MQVSIQDKHANQWKDGLIHELGNSKGLKSVAKMPSYEGPNKHAHMHKSRHQYLGINKTTFKHT